jgi:hypothetical protein
MMKISPMTAFTKWRFLEHLSTSSSLALQTFNTSLCSWLCLSNAIIELQPMYSKVVPRLPHWKVKVNCICNKGMFISRFVLYIWTRGISCIIQKKYRYKHMGPFSSLPSWHIHFIIIYKSLIDRRFIFIMTNACHSSSQWRVYPPPPTHTLNMYMFICVIRLPLHIH